MKLYDEETTGLSICLGDKKSGNNNKVVILMGWSSLGRGAPISDMKGEGMLVVSLRGVNFRFWSHLGCSEQSATEFSHRGLI